MPRITVVLFTACSLFLVAQTSLAAPSKKAKASAAVAIEAPDCEAFVSAFNIHEELINGKLIEKHTVFELTDWTPSSSLDGIVLKKEKVKDAKKLSLKLEFEKDVKKPKIVEKIFTKFEDWKFDKSYSVAVGLQDPASEMKKYQPKGHYTVQVLDDKKILCDESFDIGQGD